MKVVALVSGGKDSCYNMMQCVAEGHDIVALANLRPKDKDELDSYMYQTVGHQAIDLYAEAMDLPLYRRTLEGASVRQTMDYTPTDNDEVEDLYQLLHQIKNEMDIDAVSVGAILSDYQRVRVENVCGRLGLTPLAFLWRRDQEELMQEMIECGVHAVIIKVAALGLDPQNHLGKTLAEIYPHMLNMKAKFGLNVCGEGGEFETFTLDCPLFKKKIVIDEMETIIHSDDAFAPVGYLNFNKMHLEDKNLPDDRSMKLYLAELPMKRSCGLMKELFGKEGFLESDVAESIDMCLKCKLNQLQGDYRYVHRSRRGVVVMSGIMGKRTDDMSVEDCTRQAMDKLTGMLSERGATTKDLLAVHLYVENMSDFSQVNSIYKTYFSINPPIRVCVEVPLPENVVLQLDCIALLEDSSTVRTMHVQGLSHWAPANIGPYSQAKQVGCMIYVAGQIAMCPSDLSMIGGVAPQARLSLRHVNRILAAMAPGCSVKDAGLVICYVTNHQYISVARREWKFALEQHADQAVAKESHSLIQYVVVPHLPRAALVEWQLYAVTDWSGHWKAYKTTQKMDGLIGRIEMYQSNQDDVKLLSFTINISFSVMSERDSLVEKSVIDLFVSCVLKTLSEAEVETEDLRTLRIFYVADLMDMDKLNIAYQELHPRLVHHTATAPAVAFVPVLGFESPDTIMVVCH